MRKFILILIFIIFPNTANASDINHIIDKTTVYLMNNWDSDKSLKGIYPPQVVTTNIGTKVYGGCGDYKTGIDVGGSYYCPATHTIVLDPKQLKSFVKYFGNSSIAFIIAHEFAHALQQGLEIEYEKPHIELQADCLAGHFIQKGNKELGINRENILEMAYAAYSIGSESHGSGSQRAYALLSGMGRVDLTCSKASIDKLVKNEIDDPLYKKFSKTRGSGKSVDLAPTPYKKDAAGLLGVNLKSLSKKTKYRF
tara:strand:- start:5 stop:763 length:759 start_codon:yes stop_codon:yes gene_type:complete